MSLLNALARVAALATTLVCFGCTVLYALVGGSSAGRAWLFGVARDRGFVDAKGGSIATFIGLPILVAGTACSLLAVQPVSRRGHPTVLPRPTATALARARSWLSERGCGVSKDVDYDILSLLFIVIPCLVFVASTINRKGASLKSVANMLGMVSIVATSFVLVPVSRQSPIYHALGISSLRAVRIHMWASWVVVLAAVAHGALYTYQWITYGDSMSYRFLPPRACWPFLDDGGSTSRCYEPFRNLTGLIAVLAMVIMSLLSIYQIRRYWYRLFYISHVVAAPLAIFMTLVHYNRAVLYFIPGVIYYVASSFPVLMESFLKRFVTAPRGVQVLSVDYIPDDNISDPRPCVCFTIAASDAAMQGYRPGMYVNLTVPDITQTVAHPFTVNRVPCESHQLRIMLRAAGKPSTFTRKLVRLVADSGAASDSDVETDTGRLTDSGPKQFTPMFVDGFFGQANRLGQILQHDTVVIVAGGIGITPYLSLLEDVVSYRAAHSDDTDIHHVALHWVCRDPQLIEYVQKEYFDRLKTPSKSDMVTITIHNTRPQTNEEERYSDHGPSEADNVAGESSFEMVNTPGQTQNTNATKTVMSYERTYFTSMGGRSPFVPSHFSSSSRSSILGNIPSFLTFSIIAWPAFHYMWFAYAYVQHGNQVSQRSYSLVATVFIGLAVAMVANVILMFIPEHILQSASSGRRHGGKWWGALDASGVIKSHASDPIDDETGIECANLSDFPDNSEGELEIDSVPNDSPTAVSIHHATGRPCIGELLNPLQNSANPGLFYCAPVSFANELHKTLKAQRGASRSCMPSHVAVYEEAFSI